MKKIVSCLACLSMLLALTFTAVAGDIPESLMNEDGAKVFFGKLVSFTENTQIEVSPFKAVKGDVVLREYVTFDKPVIVGDIEMKPDEIYLCAYAGEGRSTYIFKPTSYDLSTMKISGAEQGMWKRMQEYLNSGEFTTAENKRIYNKNKDLKKTGESTTILNFMNLNSITIESVDLIYHGKKYNVDKDAFLEIAAMATLDDIENTNIDTEDGLYIVINNDYYTPMFISDGCMVEKHSPKFSRPPFADYVINPDYVTKLIGLFQEEADSALPPITIKSNLPVYIGVGAAVIAVAALGVVLLKKKSKKEN